MNQDIEKLIEDFKLHKDTSLNTKETTTHRVDVITNFLDSNEIEYYVDQWKISDRWLNNVYVRFNFNKSEREYRMFDAHHDVANYVSENAQDNTCSVINLLLLAKQLKENPINKNVLIVFTDGEEVKVGGMGSGAARAQETYIDLDIYASYALELTGLGNSIWHSENNFSLNSSTKLNCPFNNSVVYRRTMSSTCIGILPTKEIEENKIKTWALCHSNDDTFDKCNINDMVRFIHYLYQIANSEYNEVVETKDPLEMLSSLGLSLYDLYKDRISIKVSSDLVTNDLELLVLPTNKNSLIKKGYCAICVIDNKAYIRTHSQVDLEPVNSMKDISNFIERSINIS
jgi:hypothetical protein